jgi:catechol 2,3-dioxygenase-like lactoylglutathione lyase family enzyme
LSRSIRIEEEAQPAMTNVRFDHCVIRVTNWGASNAFYREVLGAEVVSQGEGWVYRFGDAQLNCHGPGVDASPVAKRPVMPGGSDLCFEWPGPVEAEQARAAVLGTTNNGGFGSGGFNVGGFGAPAAPAGFSPGQSALLQAAGAGQADPNIRQLVTRENSALAEEAKSFTDDLVFWQSPEPPGTVVDASKEAQRIQNNQALGNSVTTGETPQIERREKGILEGIF